MGAAFSARSVLEEVAAGVLGSNWGMPIAACRIPSLLAPEPLMRSEPHSARASLANPAGALREGHSLLSALGPRVGVRPTACASSFGNSSLNWARDFSNAWHDCISAITRLRSS